MTRNHSESISWERILSVRTPTLSGLKMSMAESWTFQCFDNVEDVKNSQILFIVSKDKKAFQRILKAVENTSILNCCWRAKDFSMPMA
jgi:hypothetical protein